MDGLTIFWTNTAKIQRDQVFKYWNNRNKSTEYSKKLNLAIRERTDLIKIYPEMGKPTNFKATRAIIMGHYSLLYQIQKTNIIITAFWDNREDPKKLLRLIQTA